MTFIPETASLEPLDRKKISVVSGCCNEAESISELHDCLLAVFESLPQCDHKIILIDNESTYGTQAVIRELAAENPNPKGIFNMNNFWHIRSSHHGLLQAWGDVVVAMASDLEDPPGLIHQLFEKWAKGFNVVAAVRRSTHELGIYSFLRFIYYYLIEKLSEIFRIENFHGFGLCDKHFFAPLS